MSTSILKKQLIAAVVMVLVAMLALGTSTYAWFVTNSTVTANGMNVQATSENGIEIREATAPSTWASVASGIHGTAAQLIPTSTADASNWYHASALYSTGSAVDASTITKVAITETTGVGKSATSGDKGYYIHDQFNVRSTTANATNLVVKNVTVSGIDNLSPGLRIMTVCGTNVHIYAPMTGATTTYNVNLSTAVTALTGATGSTTTDLLAATVDNSGSTKVDVYVYFEGEDASIYTNNIPTTLANLSVTIDFTATI